MQSATVVYLTHAATLPTAADLAELLQGCDLDPAWTALAAGTIGFDSLPDALLSLAQRGAHRVEAVRGRWEADRGLCLSGEPYRLLG